MRTEIDHQEAFVAVVRAGNISEAARALRIPRATVSRSLARLEADLGVALVSRTTRKIRPTAAGQRLYERIGPLLEEWATIEQEVRDQDQAVKGAVRVSCLPLLTPALGPVCGHLARHHPDLSVEVVANVRLVDLASEGFDIALWAGDVRDPDLIQRRLTVGWVGLVASPAYLARRGTPTSERDLADHALLRGHNGAGQPRPWWPLVGGGRLPVDGRFVTNDHALLRATALDGQGIALLSEVNCERALADGRLVRVLPDRVGHEAVVWIVTTPRGAASARVRAVVDALVGQFRIDPGALDGEEDA